MVFAGFKLPFFIERAKQKLITGMNCTGSFIILESWNEQATGSNLQVNGLFHLKANFFCSFTF